MDDRYWAGAVVLAGLVSALTGASWIAGLAAVAVFGAVFFFVENDGGRWFSLLCSGSLVAVAAGLSSPLWSVAVMLLLLAWAGDALGLLTSRRQGEAYALFSICTIIFLVPLIGLRHVPLPLVIILVVILIGAGTLASLWYRLVWISQKGEP